MSARDAAALLILAGVGFFAYKNHAAAAVPVAAVPTITPTAAASIAQNAINTALAGAGLSIAVKPKTVYPDYGANYGPQLPSPEAAAAGQGAVSSLILGMGLSVPFSPASTGASTMAAGKLSPQQVKALAQKQINRFGFAVDANVATAIAIVESGDVSNPNNGCNPAASRPEPSLGESSTGLMQVLTSTAVWLSKDMGRNAYTASAANLLTPDAGMYFGLAFLDWLHDWRGKIRDTSFIVQSYNGGAGNSNAQTQAYLAKFNRAYAWVKANLGA